MVVQSSSTMRSHAKGLARRHISLALFAGVAALPLLTMGITVPSAVAKNRAESQRAEMRVRLAEREALSIELSEYRTGSTLAALQELHEELVGMIPDGVGPLKEFGELRSSADVLGIELNTVRAIRTHRVGGDGAAADVVVDEVLVTLREPVNKVFALVSEIRKHGLPILVLSFDLARETPQQRAFQSEVRFGFVRRVAPSPADGLTAR